MTEILDQSTGAIEGSPPMGTNPSNSQTQTGDTPAVHPTPNTLGDLQRQVLEMKQRNDALDQLIVECRRSFGDQLDLYPPEAANRVRLLQNSLRTPSNIARDTPELSNRDDHFSSRDRLRQHFERERSPAPLRHKAPRHMDPDPYEGKSQKELTEYLQACNRVFDYDERGYPDDQSRIKWAATFLRKEPANAWERFRRQKPDGLSQMDWEQYKTFLENLQLEPTSRRVLKALQHENAKQRPQQPILEFVNYLEEKEEYMEPFTETQKRDILFNKISDEIRKDIMKNGRTSDLKTREDVISAVALLQQAYPRKPAGDPPAKDKRDNKDKPRYEKKNSERNTGDRPDSHGKRDKTKDNPNKVPVKGSTQFLDNVTCYSCNKKGHYASRCPNNKSDSSPDKRQSTS
jgi:hypothetical protein